MSSRERQFGKIKMSGGRYERSGLPVSALAELERYSKLVDIVTHHLYLAKNPERKRVPKSLLRDSLDLRLASIETGSVVPVLLRAEPELALFGADIHDEARRLINSAFHSVSTNDSLPTQFPVAALPQLADFGRSLDDGEQFELSGTNEDSVIVNKQTRLRIQEIANLDSIETEVVIQGQITGLRSQPQQFDLVVAGPERRKLLARYSDPAMYPTLKAYLGFADLAPLTELSVVANIGRGGEIASIAEILNVELALPPEWTARLTKLSRINDGWLEASTPAPSRYILEVLEELLFRVFDRGIPRPSMYPSGEGGVQLEWRSLNRNVEIEILNSGQVEAAWFAIENDIGKEVKFNIYEIDEIAAFVGENLQ